MVTDIDDNKLMMELRLSVRGLWVERNRFTGLEKYICGSRNIDLQVEKNRFVHVSMFTRNSHKLTLK